MAKFPDKRKIGRSAEVPFRRGESWQERHKRRHNHANNTFRSDDFALWCDGMGLQLQRKNHGHHWIINPPEWPRRSRRGRLIHFAQWWPSSAKLVLGNQFASGIHCHDTSQLQGELLKQVQRLANRDKWIAEVTK